MVVIILVRRSLANVPYETKLLLLVLYRLKLTNDVPLLPGRLKLGLNIPQPAVLSFIMIVA
jgi:hypothetical protein